MLNVQLIGLHVQWPVLLLLLLLLLADWMAL